MAFDAYFLTGVLEELRAQALGTRVEKIHQPASLLQYSSLKNS